MFKIIAAILLFEIPLSAFPQHDSVDYAPVQTKYDFDWGNNSSSVLLTQYAQRQDRVMVHVHDNEYSSAEAARKILAKNGGLLVQVENNGRRLMSFKKSGRRFFFDPNRIFTARGRRDNLHFLNGRITSAALSSVKAYSAFVLGKIPPSAKVIIALHNNANGKYSIKSYKGNGRYAKDVSRIYINPAKDFDNFFIVTDKKLFTQLRKEKYNIVLLNGARATDDGSLSVYFGRKKITYINVEAQQGSFEEQAAMLTALIKVLQ